MFDLLAALLPRSLLCPRDGCLGSDLSPWTIQIEEIQRVIT